MKEYKSYDLRRLVHWEAMLNLLKSILIDRLSTLMLCCNFCSAWLLRRELARLLLCGWVDKSLLPYHTRQLLLHRFLMMNRLRLDIGT